MKTVYPIILSQGKKYVVVAVPDLNIDTQGRDIADALDMARDAISLTAISLEDRGLAVPKPSAIDGIQKESEGDIVTLVDVDFEDYRRKNDMRTVKKNCSLPAWLEFEAEKAGVNYSAILQTALKKELRLDQRKAVGSAA